MSNDQEIELEGKRYVYRNGDWYDSKTFVKPPKSVLNRINALLQNMHLQSDASITDFNALLDEAKKCRESQQFPRAERLIRKALTLQPGNEGALAVLCSVLRRQGRAQEALDQTAACRRSDYAPLLTSRAGALCDLGRWEEAKQIIGRVLAKSGEHTEAFEVVHRIKAARPDLY
jgi:predicted Zn-dependent protease